jgi:hypothetical protein
LHSEELHDMYFLLASVGVDQNKEGEMQGACNEKDRNEKCM